MKAGLATIALRQFDVFEAIRLAGMAGFDGVEIWGRDPHTPDVFDEAHTNAIRECAEANGLEIPIFGSYANSATPDFEQKADTAINIAQILGAGVIRVWAGQKEPPFASEEDWTYNANKLGWMAKKAADHAMQLAMEMHGSTLALTPEGVLRLIELAGQDNLKLNYQVADAANPDLERGVELVGRYTVMVHAQNSYIAPEGSEHRYERSLIEDGVIDYAHLLRLLKGQGFDGYVEVEFLKGDGNEDQMMDSLRKDAAYLKKITQET